MRRVVLTWGAVLIALVAAPDLAGAQPPEPARLAAALGSGMSRIGGNSGAYVVDVSNGQTLYSQAPDVGRNPASVEKLYTTSTALLRLGPSTTLRTSVLGIGGVDPAGVYHGVLYLKGGGDPSFGSLSFDRFAYGSGATMQRLVTNLVRALHITAIQGRIVGDETYFDSLRGTPPTGFGPDLPDVEGLLSGLAYNRGFADLYGNLAQPRPALYATQQFVTALRAAHVRVPRTTPVYTARAPGGAQQLAAVESPRIASLIQLTNTPSDNYFAEMLLKGLGARFGGAGTTAAGVAVIKAELSSQFGISPTVSDGSGLSRRDYTSPRDVVTLLSKLYSNPDFFNSLAIGGRTGTLKHAMRDTAAQGVCHGKTGTLSDVANLVGYCQARDAHELAFAFLANGVGDTTYVHAVEANSMAAAVARYNG